MAVFFVLPTAARTGKRWYSTRRDDGTFVDRGLENTTTTAFTFDAFDPEKDVPFLYDIGPFAARTVAKAGYRRRTGIPAKWRNTTYGIGVRSRCARGMGRLQRPARSSRAENVAQ